MSHSLLYRSGRVLALAALTLVLGASAAVAQQSRVEGTVRSSQSRDPVANARVSVVGTNLFATTNENGYYAIENVPVGTYDVRVQVIGFQSVVYTNQRVAAGLPTTVNFELSPSILRIEGVVVTGVAEQTQAVKLPFTVEQLGAEDMPVPSQNAEEAIRGKVAGARVVKGGGTPGSGVTVLLRGATSISTAGRSNEPLYVVDGVILGSGMTDIDALDIENIEVVKGAAAAALYGARAANGVISITTRRGSRIPDGETRITFRSEYGRNSIEHYTPVAQSHWYRVDGAGNWIGKADDGTTDSLVSPNDRAMAGRLHGWTRDLDYVRDSTLTLAGTDPDCTPAGDDTNCYSKWRYAISDNAYGGTTYNQLDQFFNPGASMINQMSVSHRTGNTNFRASAHEQQDEGVLPGLDGYTRRGMRLNVDHRIGRSFDFNASAFYSQSVQDGDGEGFFALQFYPIDVDLTELNPVDERRDSLDYLIQPDPWVMEENPLYDSQNEDETNVRGRMLGSIGIRWRPTDFFDVESQFSFDRSDRNNTWYWFKGYRTLGVSTLNDGRFQQENEHSQALNASVSATVIKEFGDLATNFKVRALIERQSFEEFSARAQDLAVDAVRDLDVGDAEQSQVWGSSWDVRSFGYFGSGQLDFKDRYIADFLLRRDGSSLFGQDQRWHWYYRTGGAWRVSEEAFWPMAGLVDEFKLRYSRGTAGGRPRFSAQYETYDVEGGQVSKNTLGNRLLKPEHATEQEMGIDMIIGGRLSLGLTYAHSVVENQILSVPLAGFYGFGNQWRNAGTLTGKTYEGTLQAAIFQTPDASWSVNFVIDRTKQQITEFNLPAYITQTAFYIREGEMLGTMYGHRWATTCGEVYTSSGLGVACDQFEVNDDGYMVAVGNNTWTDGIDQTLYGSTVTIDGTDFVFGLPFYAREEKIDSVESDAGVLTSTDTTNFLEIGSSIPDANFGFGNNIRWKGITLYALFDAQIGGDVYNNTRSWALRERNGAEVDQAGKIENTKKPIDYYGRLYDVNAINDHFVEDATYLKFRELSLRYTFNRGQLEGIAGGFFKRVTVSLIGRNLKTWTNYTGFDPEVSTAGDAGIYRFDGFGYPNYRSFTGSLEIEF